MKKTNTKKISNKKMAAIIGGAVSATAATAIRDKIKPLKYQFTHKNGFA